MSDGHERVLLLMRHAEAGSFAADDHARELTEHGRAAAQRVGRLLAETWPVVDHALVSSAVRTRQTYAGVARGAGLDLEPRVEDALYSAGEDSALEVIRTADPDARTVLWVGHNPTVAMLAQALGDDEPDTDAFVALTRGFPPAGVAVLGVDGPWADLRPGGARLLAFHVDGA